MEKEKNHSLRKYKRVNFGNINRTCEEKTVVRFQVFQGKEKFLGKLASISQGGLYITTPRVLKPNSIIFLHFDLGNRKVQCIGKVIYSNPIGNPTRPVGFGVKFTRIVRKDFDAIRRKIDDHHLGPTFEGLARNIQ